MTSLLRLSHARWLLAAVCALAVLALGASPALADTELGHTGSVGTHMLRDTMAKPGVTCTYKDTNTPGVPYTLVAFHVRPPKVWARDVTGGIDQQQVGWRFIVEQDTSPGTGDWVTFYKSSIQKASATDSDFASFSTMTARPSVPAEAAHYRVKVKMFWYRNGATEGTALHLVDYYHWVSPTDDTVFGPSGSCLDGLGN